MINLYTSYYTDPSKLRQQELDSCLQKNIENMSIDNIYLLLEYPIYNSLLTNPKIKFIYIKGRPEYNTFFEFINRNTGDNDWNIIANSDIYFDSTLIHLLSYNIERYCIALTRYEVLKDGVRFLNRRDSQDSWAINGVIDKVDGGFRLGSAGCDNAIADRFNRAGYKVLNPSKTIKTYHLHLSGARSYNVNEKVPQPYYLIQPTE